VINGLGTYIFQVDLGRIWAGIGFSICVNPAAGGCKSTSSALGVVELNKSAK
jgi:hypothetical protein